MSKRVKQKPSERTPARSRAEIADIRPATAGWEDWIERREKWLLVAIVALGLAIRLVHLFQIRDNDPFFALLAVDPKVYHEWATRLAAGDWVGQGVFFLSPLYPYFLGLLYTLFGGPDLFLARLAQMVIGAASALLVHAIGKRLFDIRVGLLAALLHALYVMNVFYDGMLLVAALQGPLNLLMFWLLLRALDRPAAWRFALAGATLGLSIAARPNMLLFLVVVVIAVLLLERGRLHRRTRLLATGAFVLGAALVVAPVTLRNALVGGDFVLVSAQSGANLYIGNGPDATGAFVVPRVFPSTRADDPLQQEEAYRRFAEAETGRELTPSEVSAFWTGKAVEQMVADPARALRLFVKKLGLFFNAWEIGNSQDFYMSRDFSLVMRWPLPGFGIILPFALLGLAAAILRWRERFLLLGIVLVYAASLTLYFVLAHYRMPVVPFLLVLAAAGLFVVVDLARRRKNGLVVLALVGVLAGAGLGQLELLDRRAGEYMIHYNLGNRFRLMGQLERARQSYERSIALNDRYISAYNNLGLVCAQLPDGRECAVAAWRKVHEMGLAYRDQMYVDRAQNYLRALGASPP